MNENDSLMATKNDEFVVGFVFSQKKELFPASESISTIKTVFKIDKVRFLLVKFNVNNGIIILFSLFICKS